MKRTLENCRIIKRHGKPEQHNGLCVGMGYDEPCEICKECRLHTYYAETHEVKQKSKRNFTWAAWDYDCDGEAYILAKDMCPKREDVPAWIVKEDHLDRECINPAIGEHLNAEDVKEGWCKYQVRTDWDNCDDSRGGYVVEDYEPLTKKINGKRNPGWFPVWIIRKGEWY